MSQHDFDIANQTSSNARADINLALKALGSLSSGSSAPTTTYANMLWYDTSANILKMRAEADDAWINIGYLDQSADAFYILNDTKVVGVSGVERGLLGAQSEATWETGTSETESLVSPAKVKAAIDSLVTTPTSAGAVGTYAYLANRTGTANNAGETEAGSNLYYGGIRDTQVNAGGNIYGGSTSGTWRLMGNLGSSVSGGDNSAFSVWLRIS